MTNEILAFSYLIESQMIYYFGINFALIYLKERIFRRNVDKKMETPKTEYYKSTNDSETVDNATVER